MTLMCGPEPPERLDIARLGAGLFVRSLGHVSPQLAADHLDWIAVAVRSGKLRINRARSWYAEARERGLTLAAWDWLVPIGEDVRGVREAIEFAAGEGCRLFALNIEKPHRDRRTEALAYARAAREACDDHGLALGLVSYSVASTIRDLPWRELAELCDVGIPEVYDREGAYDPRYPSRAIDSYRDVGFRTIVPACGIYQRDDGGPWRWRMPDEIARHLALFPQPLTATIAWPIGGKPPADRLAALRAGVSR